MLFKVFLFILLSITSTSALITNNKLYTSTRVRHSLLSMAVNDNDILSPFLGKIKSFMTKSKVASTLLSIGLMSSIALSPAHALPGSLEEANNKLSNYNLPPILFVPPGFSPLVSEFGRGNNKEKMTNPILVQFSRPQLWVIATTTINNNGEAGTISANDYIKGDSAFFFQQPQERQLNDISKDTITKFLTKSLSQKGDPLDSFKVVAVRPVVDQASGRIYYIVDISYLLNTQAGFVIERKGVASITSVGPSIEGLVSVTTSKRYKNLEPSLRDIANSFRVYPLNSGIFASGGGGAGASGTAPSTTTAAVAQYE